MTLIAGLAGEEYNYVACDSLVSEMYSGRVYVDHTSKCYVWKRKLVVVAAGDVSQAQTVFRYIDLSPAKWAHLKTPLEVNGLVEEMMGDLGRTKETEKDVQCELVLGNPYGVYHIELGDSSVATSPGRLVAGGMGGAYAIGAHNALTDLFGGVQEDLLRKACESVADVCIGVSLPVVIHKIARA